VHGHLPHVDTEAPLLSHGGSNVRQDREPTGPRCRLVFAKDPKYCPSDKPKNTKYNCKKYERFGQGQGGIDQRRGRMKYGHCVGLVWRGNSCADYLPRIGKVLSIPDKNLIVFAIDAKGQGASTFH
jgi:hypothetical protein